MKIFFQSNLLLSKALYIKCTWYIVIPITPIVSNTLKISSLKFDDSVIIKNASYLAN